MREEYGFSSFQVDAAAFKPAVTSAELRLGNWLQSYGVWLIGDKSEKKIIGPFRVDIKTIEILSRPDALLATMEPIPLTPEILEKCGFVTYPSGCIDRFVKDRLYLENNWQSGKEYKFRWERMDHTGDTPTTKVKTVHQLQNLYFALTGEELSINL